MNDFPNARFALGQMASHQMGSWDWSFVKGIGQCLIKDRPSDEFWAASDRTKNSAIQNLIKASITSDIQPLWLWDAIMRADPNAALRFDLSAPYDLDGPRVTNVVGAVQTMHDMSAIVNHIGLVSSMYEHGVQRRLVKEAMSMACKTRPLCNLNRWLAVCSRLGAPPDGALEPLLNRYHLPSVMERLCMVPLEPSTPDFLATLQTSLNSTFDAEYTQRAAVLRGKPLHMAALANATDTLKCLLDMGADPFQPATHRLKNHSGALQAPQHFEKSCRAFPNHSAWARRA